MTQVTAQITPDSTLGVESSVVTPVDQLNDQIQGGAARGGNLFHSFTEFNVGEGRGVDFVNPDSIDNIITRVTGGNVSNILGRLGVLGEANLFLINPAGIIFGEGARLDIGGSFYGSTADSILFPNGVEFSATNPQRPILKINRPIGLGLGNNPGTIINRSVVQNSTGDLVGLEVALGKTLSLVGGNINFESGQATARSGNIELGALSAAGKVTLNDDGSLSFPEDVARADIILSNFADIDVTGTGGGSIKINGRNVSLSAGDFGESQIRAGITADLTSAEVQAGDITINATDNIFVINSLISNHVEANGVGNGGEVRIDTTNLTLTNGGQITSATFGEGDAGNIIINAKDNIFLDDGTNSEFGTLISSGIEANGVGNGGEVRIDTTNLTLTNGGQIISTTFGEGDAGNIIINVKDTIFLNGGTNSEFVTLISSGVEPNGVGNGGEVSIDTTNLTLTNGGQISSTTFGEGNAGTITINAKDTISLNGGTNSEFGTVIGSGVVEPNGVGNGGEIRIDTTNLTLTNGGQISSSTSAEGNADTVTINASDSIELNGSSSRGRSGLFTSAIQGSGEGGNINIFTDELRISNGATISASNFQSLGLASPGTGEPGNISIKANSLNLSNEARIVAATQAETGNSANINLEIADEIVLRNNSFISVEALNNANGGSLTIDTDFLVAIPNENSDIIANAFSGSGGRININAVGIFGIEAREELTPKSDITAFSQINPNLNGQINLNTLEIDPSRELFILPDQPLNAQISTLCTPGTAEAKSKFIITGRGGIAPNTLEAMQINPIAPDWVELPQKPNNSSEINSSSFSVPNPTPQIVEAQGWIRDENGEVILVADVNNVTGYDPWQQPRQCANN
ncbi:MAG: S-layer family protein [Xenococcaceae cyanobacterium MO_207.B15]|nr:S-layer family protein [Xenococcaceae cyanobacterium MO_207.B15]